MWLLRLCVAMNRISSKHSPLFLWWTTSLFVANWFVIFSQSVNVNFNLAPLRRLNVNLTDLLTEHFTENYYHFPADEKSISSAISGFQILTADKLLTIKLSLTHAYSVRLVSVFKCPSKGIRVIASDFSWVWSTGCQFNMILEMFTQTQNQCLSARTLITDALKFQFRRNRSELIVFPHARSFQVVPELNTPLLVSFYFVWELSCKDTGVGGGCCWLGGLTTCYDLLPRSMD